MDININVLEPHPSWIDVTSRAITLILRHHIKYKYFYSESASGSLASKRLGEGHKIDWTVFEETPGWKGA